MSKHGQESLFWAWGSQTALQDEDVSQLTSRDLRRHLEARELSTVGNKRELVERLEISIAEGKNQVYRDIVKAQYVVDRNCEEQGAAYCVGTNTSGQLGVGDLRNRSHFTVIPRTRGIGVCSVTAGRNVAFAVTESHDVYVWGEKGLSPTGGRGIETVTAEGLNESIDYMQPQLIDSLEGEEIAQVEIGASHAVAVGKGGDLFTWGRGDVGQLGLGDFCPRHTPATVYGVNEGLCICQVEAGEYHNIALTMNGDIFAWGHGRDGQLGIGDSLREDINGKEKTSFPLPVQLSMLSRERVRKIACGSGFSFAVSDSGLWSWGCGDGGVLGHGDTRTRESPCKVEALSGNYILQVSAGIWHAAAIVMAPPLVNCGYVYTWGTGLMGQLGLQDCQTFSHVPQLMVQLVKNQIYAKNICCGPNHNAIVSARGQLYMWGGNRNGCLGRMLSPGNDLSFSWNIGHVEGFGTIVDGIGRGLPRSVACGKDFTVICTYPYNGPTLDEAQQMPDGEI
eukprot:419699_1